MTWIAIVLATIVALAPLPFGAVGPRGRGALELVAFGVTALWLVKSVRSRAALPPRAACVGLFGLLGIAAFQLVPLTPALERILAPWSGTVRRAADDPARLPTTVSVAPEATASALLTGAACAGLLLCATSCAAAGKSRILAWGALVGAGFQGLHGLLVLASGQASIWGVPKTAYLDSATGTFVNRNHYAAYLAGTLPVACGLILSSWRSARGAGARRRGFEVATSTEGSRALMLGLIALLGLAGLFLSLSRAGILCGILAIGVMAFTGARGRPMRRLSLAVLILSIAAVPVVELSADRLVGRYAAVHGDLAADGGRIDVWRDTTSLVKASPLFGTGFGTFTWAFPTASRPEVRLHYTHAHNDPLQLLAEGGLAAGLCAALLAVTLLRAAAGLFGGGADPIAVGAACGLAAIAAHSIVDFDFHIPALEALAALLAGIVFGSSWTTRV